MYIATAHKTALAAIVMANEALITLVFFSYNWWHNWLLGPCPSFISMAKGINWNQEARGII